MSGVLFLGVAALWLYVAHRITLYVIRGVEGDQRFWAYAGVVAVLVPLPVLDELIADRQLEVLCRQNAVMKIDEEKIKGRRVKWSAEPLNEEVPGVAVPVTFTRGVLRDTETGQILSTRGRYVVKGGILKRAVRFSETDGPLFARSLCAPEQGEGTEAKRIGFTIIN